MPRPPGSGAKACQRPLSAIDAATINPLAMTDHAFMRRSVAATPAMRGDFPSRGALARLGARLPVLKRHDIDPSHGAILRQAFVQALFLEWVAQCAPMLGDEIQDSSRDLLSADRVP